MLERATLLRSTRRSRAALAQDEIARCRLFQRVDPGRRRVRASSEAIPTSIACKAQQAFASCGAFIPARREKPVEVRPTPLRAGCRRVVPAFTRLCRSNCRVRLQNESVVAGNGAEIEIAVATALGPVCYDM